jgi:hypothetical protein
MFMRDTLWQQAFQRFGLVPSTTDSALGWVNTGVIVVPAAHTEALLREWSRVGALLVQWWPLGEDTYFQETLALTISIQVQR